MIMKYKWKIVVAIAASIIAAAFIASVYNRGRSDGINSIELQLAKERLNWERKISDLQLKHQRDVSDVMTAYEFVVAQHKNQITKLINEPETIIRYIDRYIPIEVQCEIPKGFVDLHNQAAMGIPLNDAPDGVLESTDKTLGDVGEVVARNYYQCHEIAAQLEALQQIVIRFQQQQKEITK